MSKVKTHKATAKRFWLSGGKKGKMKKRTAGQDHFNARANGDKTRAKRRDIAVHDSVKNSIKELI